ncbi:MAG: dicarboxylate transporter, periplasmic subunit [Pseudomonadota bacterium]|jgi:TRAP-type mannitol/chloroaromatic compound transport system substrate-binding protein
MKKIFILFALFTTLLVGCKKEEKLPAGTQAEKQVFHWKMVTAWPKNFPALGTSAEQFAKSVNDMSSGRLQIKVYGAGELVPALQVFDAVAQGTAEMGHASPYYWKGKIPAAQFFTTTPFGMTALEMNSWMQYGGGQELLNELYAPFNLMMLPAGNSGMQMAGWFNKEINSVDDLKGLKMRIPGLGGEVLSRAGGAPVMLPGGEIFTALQTGTIDATEWVGPYNDLAFGLQKAAKYYYYPGWHEPGSLIELMINKDAFAKLPADLQSIVRVAAQAANQQMLVDMTAHNMEALKKLKKEAGVEPRPLPAEVLAHLKTLSNQVLKDVAEQDPSAKKVYESLQKYSEDMKAYQAVSEQAFLNAR